ncbi:hypothetical protein FNV43_RR16860 [Rhamnella rubrinervis]|uniref:Nudix hydrolase domain-containing protein n=1 Tax=Rhamnella rubrinervis TaxID=2594499 RepID=A0A8K0MDU6_9ROSA|nr:hypothetical protein FNV43_RR16860 [Rhamnella rubrinervis]
MSITTIIGTLKWPVPALSSQRNTNTNFQLLSKGVSQVPTLILSKSSSPIANKLNFSPNLPFNGGGYHLLKKTANRVLSPDISSPSTTPVELLEAWNDNYDGVVICPESLPMSANAFACALRTSLSIWKLKGKKGVWLKLLLEQADLVPIAIQEGFKYHHAESGYVMLTYWIPDELSMLPESPSHQIGVGGFVINDQREVLVVKEKCPCSCSGVWKLPTGYVNKSEDIFSAAIREVKEETGIDTMFLEIVAFRHAHLVTFEKSDLLFVCMLKPLSSKITIDDKEIQAAKWMPIDELLGLPFYQDDHMSKKVIDVCMAAYEAHGTGFVRQQTYHSSPSRLFILKEEIKIGLRETPCSFLCDIFLGKPLPLDQDLCLGMTIASSKIGGSWGDTTGTYAEDYHGTHCGFDNQEATRDDIPWDPYAQVFSKGHRSAGKFKRSSKGHRSLSSLR